MLYAKIPRDATSASCSLCSLKLFFDQIDQIDPLCLLLCYCMHLIYHILICIINNICVAVAMAMMVVPTTMRARTLHCWHLDADVLWWPCFALPTRPPPKLLMGEEERHKRMRHWREPRQCFQTPSQARCVTANSHRAPRAKPADSPNPTHRPLSHAHLPHLSLTLSAVQ